MEHCVSIYPVPLTFFRISNRFYLCFLLALLVPNILCTQGLEDIEHSTAEVDNLLQNAASSLSDADIYATATKALSMARDLRFNNGIVRASILLAQVCMRSKRTEEALQHYLEAEEKLGSDYAATPLLLNKPALLAVYKGLGDLFAGEKLYDNARRYYRKILTLTPDDYLILEKTADAFLSESKIDSADAIYERLLQHFEDQGNTTKLIQVYQKLANAYDNAGNTERGLFYYRAIENLVHRTGSSSTEKAVMYNNIGKQYARAKDYKNALEYFDRARILCEYIDCDYLDLVYANLGIALHNTGNSRLGMEYLLKARRLLEQKKARTALASLEHLIAGAYFKGRDVYNALTHNNEAIRYALETRQNDILANCYRTGADIYYQLYDFENAYDYYQKYLNLNDSIRSQELLRQQRIDQQRALLTTREGQIKYLIARQNFKDLENQQLQYEKERLSLINANQELELQRNAAKVKQLEAEQIASEARLNEQTLLAIQAQQQLLLSRQSIDSLNKERLIATLRQQEQLDRTQRQADSVRMERLRQEQAFQKREQENQKREQENFKLFAYGIGGLGLVILLLLGIGWWMARRSSRRLAVQNRKIEAQKELIEVERQKSERLLVNILPDEIAHELRAQGYANPRFYDSATVLFTDFLNFTKLSEKLSPEQLIDELDECFLAFDEICEKHGLEKIKTIGDAYMCAGGLPLPNDTHAVDAVSAALEMNAWLDRRNRENANAVFREMRIGIHTGPVIAGVIGKNKFAYDIWGDAVNLASRLEELGEPGRINISGSTYEAVKHRFNCSFRGKKEVHNKGLVEMYFIEG